MVSNHNNVVKLYDRAETDKDYQMFMEYCDKGDYFADKILEVSLQYLLYNTYLAPHADHKQRKPTLLYIGHPGGTRLRSQDWNHSRRHEARERPPIDGRI